MYYFDIDPVTKQFPRLDDLHKKLLKKYYEAEFEDDKDLCQSLKQRINMLELKMELGEEYEVPF